MIEDGRCSLSETAASTSSIVVPETNKLLNAPHGARISRRRCTQVADALRMSPRMSPFSAGFSGRLSAVSDVRGAVHGVVVEEHEHAGGKDVDGGDWDL